MKSILLTGSSITVNSLFYASTVSIVSPYLTGLVVLQPKQAWQVRLVVTLPRDNTKMDVFILNVT